LKLQIVYNGYQYARLQLKIKIHVVLQGGPKSKPLSRIIIKSY